MSEQEETESVEEEQADAATATADATETEAAESDSVPEFQQLDTKNMVGPGNFDLARFGGVQVTLTAELGRTKVTLQELMGLSEGTVMELDRSISAPVEIIAQGAALGNGEVVVVDDRFAIRIKEIYQVS